MWIEPATNVPSQTASAGVAPGSWYRTASSSTRGIDMRRFRSLISSLARRALIATAVWPAAGALPTTARAQGDLIPLDTAVRTGTLPNGLRYYIRRNTRPEKRVELRLVINAGSVLEDDDQKGLAHFTEHMLFNGTRRFAKNDIVSYLESIGVRFGADL